MAIDPISTMMDVGNEFSLGWDQTNGLLMSRTSLLSLLCLRFSPFNHHVQLVKIGWSENMIPPNPFVSQNWPHSMTLN
mgnify:CR=1 FL=1